MKPKSLILKACGMLTTVSLSAGMAWSAPLATMLVVGPGGESMIYYKDGSDIVVRNCGQNYAKIDKIADCVVVGQENRIPADVFKRALKMGVTIQSADRLNPLTAEEAQAYKDSDPARLDATKAKTKELEAKLERIKYYITNFGPDDKSKADQADTDKLLADAKKELTTLQKGGDAIRKVNDLVDKIVDKQIADSAMHPVSSGKNNNEAQYALLKDFDASRPECGTDELLAGVRAPVPAQDGEETPKADKGAWLEKIFISSAFAQATKEFTIDQRIKDCAGIPQSTKTSKGVKWNMVARKRDRKSGQFYEVWKDAKSGLIWGDRLDNTITHYNAVDIDANGKISKEKACASTNEDGKKANAGITGKNFGMPSIDEWTQAENDGVRGVLPNMNYWFWSASLYPNYEGNAQVFSGGSGGSSYGGGYGRGYGGSVRCVGR